MLPSVPLDVQNVTWSLSIVIDLKNVGKVAADVIAAIVNTPFSKRTFPMSFEGEKVLGESFF